MADRPRLNLTPLLDVLLLMIFAFQFQSRLIVADASVTAQVSVGEIERIRQDAARLRGLVDDLSAENARLKGEMAANRAQTLALATQLHRAYGSISQEDFYAVLAGAEPGDREQIRAVIARLDAASPRQIIAELARHQAFTRHVPTLFVRLGEAGALGVSLNDGPVAEVAVAENDVVMRARLNEALRNRLEGEPRGLVLLFFSWGDVLKTEKDRLEEMLRDIAARDLPRTWVGAKIHYVPEGFRP